MPEDDDAIGSKEAGCEMRELKSSPHDDDDDDDDDDDGAKAEEVAKDDNVKEGEAAARTGGDRSSDSSDSEEEESEEFKALWQRVELVFQEYHLSPFAMAACKRCPCPVHRKPLSSTISLCVEALSSIITLCV